MNFSRRGDSLHIDRNPADCEKIMCRSEEASTRNNRLFLFCHCAGCGCVGRIVSSALVMAAYAIIAINRNANFSTVQNCFSTVRSTGCTRFCLLHNGIYSSRRRRALAPRIIFPCAHRSDACEKKATTTAQIHTNSVTSIKQTIRRLLPFIRRQTRIQLTNCRLSTKRRELAIEIAGRTHGVRSAIIETSKSTQWRGWTHGKTQKGILILAVFDTRF